MFGHEDFFHEIKDRKRHFSAYCKSESIVYVIDINSIDFDK